VFEDREDAGRSLALHLEQLGVTADVVLGLPRGGVPVAAEVAAELGLPLDVIVVRKLGIPSHPEVAMGSIGEGGVRIVDADIVRRAGVTRSELGAVEQHEREVFEHRAQILRGGRRRLDLTRRTVLIVDDGIATGATASAACLVARGLGLGAERVVVAAPVGGRDAVRRIEGADQVICLEQPLGFQAVGAYYRDFGQTSTEEVLRLLQEEGERR
jgi:putative phosphoribosyl transferase